MEDNFNEFASENSTDEIYKRFPFLSAFPFKQYSISLQKDEFEVDLDIDPIIINSVGSLESPKQLCFHYVEQDTQIMLSFYEADVDFIYEKSSGVKFFDEIRRTIDLALDSDSINHKIEAIKRCNKFLSEVNSALVPNSNFIGVLNDLLGANGIVLPTRILSALHKMSSNIKEEKFSIKEKSVVSAYFNFHLHHAKIVLGIIIAAKIY